MFVFDPKTEKVTKTLDVSCSNMTLSGDSLFVYSTEWSYITGANTISYTVIDTKSQEVIDRNFIKDGTEKDIKIPYGIAVNREQGEFYVTDAKNYVTPRAPPLLRPQDRDAQVDRQDGRYPRALRLHPATNSSPSNPKHHNSNETSVYPARLHGARPHRLALLRSM